MEFSPKAPVILDQTALRLAYLASQGLLTSEQHNRVNEITKGAELPAYGAGTSVDMAHGMQTATAHQTENELRIGQYL